MNFVSQGYSILVRRSYFKIDSLRGEHFEETILFRDTRTLYIYISLPNYIGHFSSLLCTIIGHLGRIGRALASRTGMFLVV